MIHKHSWNVMHIFVEGKMEMTASNFFFSYLLISQKSQKKSIDFMQTYVKRILTYLKKK